MIWCCFNCWQTFLLRLSPNLYSGLAVCCSRAEQRAQRLSELSQRGFACSSTYTCCSARSLMPSHKATDVSYQIFCLQCQQRELKWQWMRSGASSCSFVARISEELISAGSSYLLRVLWGVVEVANSFSLAFSLNFLAILTFLDVCLLAQQNHLDWVLYCFSLCTRCTFFSLV